MAGDHDTPGMRAGSRAADLLATLLLTALVFLLQATHNAFGAELMGDDASHYMSGLMIRDYLAGGPHGSPIAYLKWYHAHYPLIGIGHWGPAYYGLEGFWMLLVSPSIPAAVALAGLITAATAWLIYFYGVRKLGLPRIYAFAAAAAFVLAPLVQVGSQSIMLDIPIAFLAMAAAYAYATYLERPRAAYSLLFGLFAAVALLTKGNGALLALLPPLAVTAAGKWRLVTRLSFWAPALVVGLLAGPWYVLTYGQVSAGFRFHWGLDYTRIASIENTRYLYESLGPLILGLAAAGVVVGLRSRDEASRAPRAVLLALLVSTWVFQVVVPAALQDRYLAPMVPPTVLFAALGARAIVEALRKEKLSPAFHAAAAALIVAAMLPAALSVAARPSFGLRQLAPRIWAELPRSNPVLLIATQNSVEGAVIAELAMADPHRPSMFAVRGSRLLGGGGYNRADYVPRFTDPRQVASEITRRGMPLVLHEADGGGWAHVAQVEDVRAEARPPWRLIDRAGTADDPMGLYALPTAARPASEAEWIAVSAPKALK